MPTEDTGWNMHSYMAFSTVCMYQNQVRIIHTDICSNNIAINRYSLIFYHYPLTYNYYNLEELEECL